MANIEIIGSERAFSATPARQGLFDRVVTYRTEDQLLHFVVLPDETYTVTKAQEAITRNEAERRLQTPHKFTIP